MPMKRILLLMSLLIVMSPLTIEAATVTLTWTAPSDNVGVVAYDLRYSTSPFDSTSSAWWAGASAVTGLPSPSLAGQTDSVSVTLPPGTYYFNIISRDAAMNWSGWSNVAVKTVTDTAPPFRIWDLR